MEKKSDMMKPV